MKQKVPDTMRRKRGITKLTFTSRGAASNSDEDGSELKVQSLSVRCTNGREEEKTTGFSKVQFLNVRRKRRERDGWALGWGMSTIVPSGVEVKTHTHYLGVRRTPQE